MKFADLGQSDRSNSVLKLNKPIFCNIRQFYVVMNYTKLLCGISQKAHTDTSSPACLGAFLSHISSWGRYLQTATVITGLQHSSCYWCKHWHLILCLHRNVLCWMHFGRRKKYKNLKYPWFEKNIHADCPNRAKYSRRYHHLWWLQIRLTKPCVG